MRRPLLLVLAIAAALTVGIVAISSAATVKMRAGNLVLTFSGDTEPRKLPKRSFAPVALKVGGVIATTDGRHPSAFREALVDIDRNGRINARGLPICRGGQLEARNTRAARRVCGNSRVGGGNAITSISFPEQRPIRVRSPLTIFNGGVRGGKTTLFIHTFITVPVPAAIVTTITVRNIRQGRLGLRTLSRIPVIAGGSGSVLRFNFRIRRDFRHRGQRRSYLTARCQDGRFLSRIVRAQFRNEAGEPGAAARTNLSGRLVVPCRQR